MGDLETLVQQTHQSFLTVLRMRTTTRANAVHAYYYVHLLRTSEKDRCVRHRRASQSLPLSLLEHLDKCNLPYVHFRRSEVVVHNA